MVSSVGILSEFGAGVYQQKILKQFIILLLNLKKIFKR